MFIFLLCAFHLEGLRLALVTPRAPRPLPRDKVKALTIRIGDIITPILKMQVQIRCSSQLLVQSGGSLLPALPSRYCGSRHRTEINQPLNHVNPASNPHPRLGGKHRDIAKIIGNVLAAYGFPMNGILTMQPYSLQALLVGDGYRRQSG